MDNLYQTLLALSTGAAYLAIPRICLAICDGNYHRAVMLTEVTRRSDPGVNQGWVGVPDSEWGLTLFASYYQTRRAREWLVDAGFLETDIRSHPNGWVMHYRPRITNIIAAAGLATTRST